jgi:hypothetical protein
LRKEADSICDLVVSMPQQDIKHAFSYDFSVIPARFGASIEQPIKETRREDDARSHASNPHSRPNVFSDFVETDSKRKEDKNFQLPVLTSRIKQSASMAHASVRTQGIPRLGRVEPGGQTFCDRETGQIDWSVDYGRVPECMWRCVERHELAHVDQDRGRCAIVATAIQRASSAVQFARQQSPDTPPERAAEALREATAATEEAEREAQAYQRHLQESCRQEEFAAYRVAIIACESDEIVLQCRETREIDSYNTYMANWRRFMTNPPNCASPRPGFIPESPYALGRPYNLNDY